MCCIESAWKQDWKTCSQSFYESSGSPRSLNCQIPLKTWRKNVITHSGSLIIPPSVSFAVCSPEKESICAESRVQGCACERACVCWYLCECLSVNMAKPSSKQYPSRWDLLIWKEGTQRMNKICSQEKTKSPLLSLSAASSSVCWEEESVSLWRWKAHYFAYHPDVWVCNTFSAHQVAWGTCSSYWGKDWCVFTHSGDFTTRYHKYKRTDFCARCSREHTLDFLKGYQKQVNLNQVYRAKRKNSEGVKNYNSPHLWSNILETIHVFFTLKKMARWMFKSASWVLGRYFFCVWCWTLSTLWNVNVLTADTRCKIVGIRL